MNTAIAGGVAIVTGAGSGIGSAIAVRLAQAGCALFLIGRTQEKLEATQSLILETTPNAQIALSCFDVTDKSLLEQSVSQCISTFGAVTIVVNNAGVGALTTSPLEKWDEVIDVNIKAAMRLIHYCLPHLEAAAKAGKLPAVLNIGSLSAKGHFGGYVPYVASKHALLGFSHSLFAAVQNLGIRVTALLPGWVDTPLISPLGIDTERCLSPEQVADSALYALTLPKNVCITELTIVPQYDLSH